MNTPVTIGRGRKKKKALDLQGLSWVGGRNRTRTCDPIDVNDVLYQLSHATMLYPISRDNRYILTQVDVPVKG